MAHYLLEQSVTKKPSPFARFFYPAKMFEDAQTTLDVLVTLEDAFIAAYLVGVRRFSSPDLRVTAARIMGIERDQRTLARVVAPGVAGKDGGPIEKVRGIQGKAMPLRQGDAILFGCKAGQQSYENETLQHGLFTYCLLDGLRGGASNEKNGEITWKHLAASCAIPLGFPPVEIDGRLYVDGGLRGGLPLWVAEDLGARRALALNVLTGPVFRALRTIMWNQMATSALQVRLLEPSRRLGSIRDALVWNPNNVERWIELGRSDASSITM